MATQKDRLDKLESIVNSLVEKIDKLIQPVVPPPQPPKENVNTPKNPTPVSMNQFARRGGAVVMTQAASEGVDEHLKSNPPFNPGESCIHKIRQ